MDCNFMLPKLDGKIFLIQTRQSTEYSKIDHHYLITDNVKKVNLFHQGIYNVIKES